MIRGHESRNIKTNGYGNGNIFDGKNLLNDTNGQYMDCKINLMAYGKEINDFYALSGTVMKKLMSWYPRTLYTQNIYT